MPYARHTSVMPSEYDNSFRSLVTAGVGIDRTHGSVDGPVGHLASVTIMRSDLVEGEEVFTTLVNADEQIPPPGRYIVHESEMGIVVVFAYDSDGDRDADWENAEAEELHWLMEECEND